MININGNSKMMCLIGNPVEHSLSPKLHNFFCEFYEFNGFYCAFKSEFVSLDKTVYAFKNLNILGFNITYPFKNEIIKYLDELDENAKLLNSVNTVKNHKGKLIGYNTDVYGFEMLLRYNNISLVGKEIAILGTGGAARAVSLALFNMNAKKIRFFTRNKDLNFKFGKNTIDEKISFHSYDSFSKLKDKLSIVINATPLGMGEKINENPLAYETLNKNHIAIDLIYKPKKTLFLKSALENQSKILNGYHMLFFQAIKSFEIWTSIECKKYDIILKRTSNQ